MLVLIHSKYSPACIDIIRLITKNSLEGLGYLSIYSDVSKKRLIECGHSIDKVPTMILFDGLQVKKYEGLGACTQVVEHLSREAVDDANFDDLKNAPRADSQDSQDLPPPTKQNITPLEPEKFQRTSLDVIEEEIGEDDSRGTSNAPGSKGEYLDNEITEKVNSTDVMAQAKAMQQQRAVDEPNDEGPQSTPREWSTNKNN